MGTRASDRGCKSVNRRFFLFCFILFWLVGWFPGGGGGGGGGGDIVSATIFTYVQAQVQYCFTSTERL